LARYGVRARVVDRAPARQRDGHVDPVEGDGDRRQRRRVDRHRSLGADRDQRVSHQPAPERARGPVFAGPRQPDRLYLGVAAAVVADDLAPRAYRAAEAERQLGEFSELALGRGDLADRGILLQYEVGEDAVVIERLVAGRVEAPKVV